MKSYKDASGLAQAIKKRELTPKDAVVHSFAKIREENNTFQAVITLFEEEALKKADQMTDLSRPFSGVPILIKDAGQDLAGQPSTLGSFLLKDQAASETSHFVRMLQDLGFIIIGQSNVPEFSLKFVSDSKLFGPVKNPVNPSFHAGGSSGGAAAAVQRGMVPIAAASDGGGSIRIPASFSGLVGLKPTRGKIITGPGAYRSWAGASINFALTRSVRDARLLLQNLQVEGIEAMPFQAPKLNFFEDVPFDIRQVKFAYSFEIDTAYPPSQEAVRALQKTNDILKSLGCTVEEAYPVYDYQKILRSYYQMNGAEQIKSFRSIEKGLGRPIQRPEVEETTWLLAEYGKRIPASLYSESLDDWDRLAHVFGEFHEEYDVLIQPATAKTAPAIEDLLFDVKKLQEIDSYASLATPDLEDLVLESFQAGTLHSPYAFIQNLTGQPALSLPLYTSPNGLPLGVMFSAVKIQTSYS